MAESYGERILRAVMEQCERRNIPLEESESFLKHVEDETGTRVLDMDMGQLRRFQQNMDAHFRSYLNGAKRRGGPAGAWPEDASGSDLMAAAKAGISISSEGSEAPQED